MGLSRPPSSAAARYAIYYVPDPATALARFARTWLGRDVEDGAVVAAPAVAGLSAARQASITADPALYGFHATLKPPFRMAPGATPAALAEAVAACAARLAPVPIPALRLAALGGFMALVPDRPVPALDALAAACVRDLDGLRAAPDAAELARRRAAGLTPRQEALLQRWGYPFVMEEFRFHLTLTGWLPEADRPAVAAALAPLAAPLCGVPVAVDALALCVQRVAGGPFTVARRFALAGAAGAS